MRNRRLFLAVPAFLLAFTLTAPAAWQQKPAVQAPASQAPEYGPAKGTLVIVGGGSTEGTTIMEKFIELGGGPDGKFVIVPTAGGNRNRRRQLIPYTRGRASSRAG